MAVCAGVGRAVMQTIAYRTTTAVKLRSWPGLPELGQPDNFVRSLPAGTNVSVCEWLFVFDGTRTWYYVVGKDYNGWVAGEYLIVIAQ